MQTWEELWPALERTVIAHTEGQAVDTGQPGNQETGGGVPRKAVGRHLNNDTLFPPGSDR